jgi:HSP20 family protein
MNSRDMRSWMWGEALSLLDQADRLHRQFFRMGPSAHAHAWEPPVDIIETPEGLSVQIALPGVAPGALVVEIEPDVVVVSALRAFPECAAGARIHRVEIPYGRFERRIALPTRLLELTGRSLKDGMLTLTFARRARDYL